MSFNFIDAGGTVATSQACLYDSNIGYETDFSVDGDVNGWTLYNGIHTYGCWNNFLFGTLYGDTSLIGRHNVFRTVAAEQFYTVKIVMKLNIIDRIGTQNIPEYGRMSWTTEADPSWSFSKEIDFTITPDNKWHTYHINMGEIQWWQGDINNLRLCPILQDGRDGDEFFVRAVKVLSINTYKCTNTACEYFSDYQHPCEGVGKRGTCSSKALDFFIQEGTIFDFAIDKKYTIVEDVNDEFLVNINGYGYESVKLPVTSNVSGAEMAKILAKEISKINVGGYSEVSVEYNTDGQFVIYSGTYVSDSVVKIGDSPAAVTLDFYDGAGIYQSSETTGSPPISGYRPLSSFLINTNQILKLFSNVENTGFFFNPFIYNVEGGRRDWLEFGLGSPSKDIRGQEDDDTGVMNRYYDFIDNAGKTIIDFIHPFNASGRITKICLAITLDNYGSTYDARGDYDEDRIDTQLKDAKVMFFRPLKDGTLKVLDITVPIENRDHVSGNLYSITQEYVDIDCDIFVNKGDLIGVYNANVYKGRSVSGSETDALFYQVNGKASGVLDIHTPSGEGSSGLLFYARSDQIQDRLVVDIDLFKRINIDSVDVIGSAVDEKLEYNIARCLDINWSVDLFDGNHSTGWVISYRPYVEGIYNHPNIYYGKDCLTDGIKTVPDGLAGTSFSADLQTYYRTDEYFYPSPDHIKNGGNGIIINGAKYFQVNGDSEWVATYLLAGRGSPFAKDDFKRDPIAFTLLFPYGKKKKLSKLKIYFKERYNFRSFALSFFKGDSYQGGTADISTFDLIPYRIDGTETPWSRLVLDGLGYVPEDEIEWGAVDLYLAHNPIVGHEILQPTSVQIGNYDSVLAYYGGTVDYDERGIIVNNDQLTQARSTDWTTLSIEWPESNELGFRLYCDYHESTKICEMELFCTVDDVGSSMAGATSVIYSAYGETLWLSETSQDIDGNVTALIGDTPQYITVEISPITEIELRNISVNVGKGDFFLGEKGCQSEILPVISKTNSENESVPVLFRNTYDHDYDLYVNIIKENIVDNGLIFYSRLNNPDSITNPEVGSDSYYKKEPNYLLRNDNYNVAINCPVYGLKNLVGGAEAWYSHDDEYSWHNFGTLISDANVDFSNITTGDFSVIKIPVISRNRYWKIGWLAEDHSQMNIREMRLYYNDEKIDCDFYHDKDLAFEDGPISDTAPHLDNGSIIGSYYGLEGGTHIGVDVGSQKVINKIIWFNDSITEYSTSTCGIDKYTELNLTVKNTCLVDYSYDEREFSIVGTGIDIGTGKHDFNYNEVTTVSGLFSSSDTSPTNISLDTKPELVDGGLWGGGIILSANHSLGIDLGFQKDITRIQFYLNIGEGYNVAGWDYRGVGGDTWYIYKSDDNVNWTLCHTMKGTDLQIQTQDNSWEFIIEFFFPVSQIAKYFKMWCVAPMYIVTTQGWWGSPTCSEIKVFSETSNSYKTGIGFSGDNDSYISVPASSDFTFPGTENIAYGELAKSFTADFHVKFNSLPVASGTSYCTLIRNWADPVVTVKHGSIPYPPENWTNEATMEVAGVSSPNANYTILVKSVYNLTRVNGATYSCSSLSWGDCEYAFKDIFNTITQWITGPPCYAQCTLPEAKKVIKYGMYGYYASGYNRQPKDWSLQAYVTASGTWVDLHTVIDHPNFAQYQMEYWTFDNPYPACTDYRIYVTKNEGHAYTRVPSIKLFDESENVIPTMYQIEFWIQSQAAGSAGYIWSRHYYEVIEGGSYHVSLTRTDHQDPKAYVNGNLCYGKYSVLTMWSLGLNSHSEDLIIGENLDGVISDLRITKDLERTDQDPSLWHKNERFYAMSIYVSEDNVHYGKFCDLDLYKETSYDHYYYPENVFSSDYYSYFAIDLGHSYDLELIRSFPVDEAYQFDLSSNVFYSNVDTADPALAFISLNIEDINTDFSGGNKELPDNWSSSGGAINYIFDNRLYQSATSDYVKLTADFYLIGNFDFEMEYELIDNVNIGNWFCGLQIQDINEEDNSIKIDRSFYDSHNRYRLNTRDNSSSWVTTFSLMTSHRLASIRFTRVNQTFTAYVKNLDVASPEEYTLFGAYEMTGGFGKEVTLSIITESTIPYNPTVSVEWDNLVFNVADPIHSSYNDARWVKIRMLSGDGVTRSLKRIGIYPDVSVQVSADNNYNTDWEDLGTSITRYVGEENIALAADTEVSSAVGLMVSDNAVNGLLTTELQQAWGSDDGTPQWITVKLPQEMQIYRIKLYLGYDDSDTDHMIQDYKVQISTDNITFSDIFTVTGNNDFSRTHDLIEPVTAVYVRVYITAYTSKNEYIKTSDGYAYWSGANIRQIDVYEYYGNTIISSEDYPIIAIDLKQSYFIRGHNMVGVDTENPDIDWDNDNSNYTYSNSNLAEPKKVVFGDWGKIPGYEKWVVIKRNTATHYPLVPDPEDYPYRDTEDYLKHVVIQGSVDENDAKPNPVEHYWMWESNISELSYSYDYVEDFSSRSLSIKYPVSSQSDHVYFIEGDDFGIDGSFSWRDGLSFYWYIDDIENLDLNYGYIYFGGYDPTTSHNSVTYKWNITTLSGVLQSGWNGLVLGMKYADEIDWTESADPEVADPRILDKLTLQKVGMIFRGKNVPITMYINGFIIERSHFKEGGFFDNGLYLHGIDILKINVGELDFHSGTLEFLLRPDWDLTGKDVYKEFKFRSLFHFGNVANDVLGASITPLGIEVYHGNLMDDLTLFRITDLDFGVIDQLMHMAFVFSNDGTNIGNDGSTLRVYINTILIAKSTTTWKVSDEKHFNFVFGGQSLLVQKMQGFIPKASSVDGVISNIKIHNYCKTDFRDSLRTADIEGEVLLTKPSDLIEISKDNVTFYKVGDTELPFFFKNVLSNEVVPVYVRTTIPKGLTGKEKRTAELLGQWDIGV